MQINQEVLMSSSSSLIDYHLHTSCSRDGSGEVIDHCREAVKRGFREICFTNHQEWISVVGGFYDYAMRNEGWEQHLRDIEAARKEFPMLSIKLGCETGYYPEYLDDIIRFTKRFPFDYIIGSVHSLEGKMLDDKTISSNTNSTVQIQWMRKYFSAIKDMVKHSYFDCIGHLDLVKKHIPLHGFDEYQDLIQDIAETMNGNDIGFELNTSGWHQSPQDCYPAVSLLKILKDAGIRKVAIGSDSHSPETLGQDIQKGLDLLKRVGFDSVCTFSNRVPTYHSLPIQTH